MSIVYLETSGKAETLDVMIEEATREATFRYIDHLNMLDVSGMCQEETKKVAQEIGGLLGKMDAQDKKDNPRICAPNYGIPDNAYPDWLERPCQFSKRVRHQIASAGRREYVRAYVAEMSS